MTTEITTYATQSATLLQQVWDHTFAAEEGDREENFRDLVTLLQTYDGEALTAETLLNSQFDALIAGTDEEQLSRANALIAGYQAMRTEQLAALDEDARIAGDIARGIDNNLIARLTNTPIRGSRGGTTGSRQLGALNAQDIEQAAQVGVDVRAQRIDDMDADEAKEILRHWIRGHLEVWENGELVMGQNKTDREVPELRAALGLADSDTTLRDFDLTNNDNYLLALNAYRLSHGVDQPTNAAELDRATIAALRSEEHNYFHAGRNAMREGRRMAGDALSGINNAIRSLFDRRHRQNSGDGQSGGEEPAEGEEQEEGNGIWGRIQEWFGGIGESLGNMNAGNWLGGVVGAAIAWFASNMFGAGPFRMIMMVLMVPMMFMLGSQMGGRLFNRDGDDDSPARDGESREPVRGRSREPEIAQTREPLSPQEFNALVQGAAPRETTVSGAVEAVLPEEPMAITMAKVAGEQGIVAGAR